MGVQESISTAQQAADLEMSQYLAQMSDSARADYAGTNAAIALDRIKALKNDRFSYLSEDLVGADNNIVSTAYYLTRTKDLKDMASDIDTVATKQLAVSDINTGVIARQNEINEWANGNKLDTLFFLQVLFICLTLISAMFFLNSRGVISNYLLNLCIILTSAVAIFVLITRARYTMVRRDGRYWSKLRYPNLHTENIVKAEDKCEPEETPKVAPKKRKVCKTVIEEATPEDSIDGVWGGYFG